MQRTMIYLLFIVATLLFEDAYTQVQQPGNIMRGEGETKVHISCEIYAFTEQVPFWRINDIDYASCNLPPPYMQSSSGLEIEIVTRDMDGTTFQCLLPSQNDLSVQKSDIGVLTVTRANGNLSIQVEEEYIEINHQNIVLNENSFTLSWRTNIFNQSCNTFLITFTHLCETLAFQENTTHAEERTITLPVDLISSEARESSVIDISVQNKYQDVCSGLRLKERVRFDVDQIDVIEIPLKNDNCNHYCINISSSTFILVISSSPRDIFCPIYIEGDNNCYNVSRCFGFMEAFDSPFFSVCKDPTQMCFTNISQVLDDVKMFFLISSRPCASPLSTKLYTKAIQIQVKDCTEDIVATEGDRYFFIACRPCESEGRSLIWKINEVNYEESDLPVFYVPSPGGLFIEQVDLSMNGTKFQCIFPADNSSLVQTSCLEVLIVIENPIETIEIFEFDLIALNINSDNVTLAWRGSYDKVCNHSYIIIEWSPLFVCDNFQSTLYNTSDNSIILPLHTSSGEDVRFNVSIQGCPISLMNPLPATFSFDRFETIDVPFGFNNCSCINVRRTFFLIISTTSDDVHCSVEIGRDEKCYNFLRECNEFSEVFDTTKTFISICKDPSDRFQYQMCFGNITEEVSDIRIYITSTVIPCTDNDEYYVRRYIQGIEIQVQANVTLTSKKVCIFHPTSTCTSFPEGNHLGVSIQDISGYSVFSDNITMGNCSEVESIQFPFCAPFQVTLNYMESRLRIPQDPFYEQESNLCRCLEENVVINFHQPIISSESFNLSIQYNCTTPYNPPSDIEISVILSVGSGVGQLSGCKNGSELIINVGNSCKMSNELLINVKKIFKGQHCYSSNSTISVVCPGQQTDNQHLQLLSLLLFILLVPLTVIGIIYIKCCCGRIMSRDIDTTNQDSTSDEMDQPMNPDEEITPSHNGNQNDDELATNCVQYHQPNTEERSGDQNQLPAAATEEGITLPGNKNLVPKDETYSVKSQPGDDYLHLATPSDNKNEPAERLYQQSEGEEKFSCKEDQSTKQIAEGNSELEDEDQTKQLDSPIHEEVKQEEAGNKPATVDVVPEHQKSDKPEKQSGDGEKVEVSQQS